MISPDKRIQARRTTSYASPLMCIGGTVAAAIPYTIAADKLYHIPHLVMILAVAFLFQNISRSILHVRQVGGLPLWVVGLLFLVTTFVLIGTEDPDELFHAWSKAVTFPLTCFLMGIGLGSLDRKWIITAIAIHGTITCGYALLVIRYGTPAMGLVQMGGVFRGRGWYPPPSWGGEFEMATRLSANAISAGVACFMVYIVRSWRQRIIFIAIYIGFGAASFFSQTRGPLFATMLVMLTMVFRPKAKTLLVLSVLALMGVIAAKIVIDYDLLPQRFTTEYLTEKGLTGRVPIWQLKISEFFDNPMGVGLTAAVEEGKSAHNQLLDSFYTYGILGGLLFLCVYLWVLREWVRSILVQRGLGLYEFSLLSLATMCVATMIETHFHSAPTAYGFFWLMLGVARSSRGAHFDRQRSRPPIAATGAGHHQGGGNSLSTAALNS